MLAMIGDVYTLLMEGLESVFGSGAITREEEPAHYAYDRPPANTTSRSCPPPSRSGR
jgi:hypothetical protein